MLQKLDNLKQLFFFLVRTRHLGEGRLLPGGDRTDIGLAELVDLSAAARLAHNHDKEENQQADHQPGRKQRDHPGIILCGDEVKLHFIGDILNIILFHRLPDILPELGNISDLGGNILIAVLILSSGLDVRRLGIIHVQLHFQRSASHIQRIFLYHTVAEHIDNIGIRIALGYRPCQGRHKIYAAQQHQHDDPINQKGFLFILQSCFTPYPFFPAVMGRRLQKIILLLSKPPASVRRYRGDCGNAPHNPAHSQPQIRPGFQSPYNLQ